MAARGEAPAGAAEFPDVVSPLFSARPDGEAVPRDPVNPMTRTAALLFVGLLVSLAIAPTAAAQLPPNPFDNFACAGPGGSGVIGFVRTVLSATCVLVVSTGHLTYEFVCDVTGGC